MSKSEKETKSSGFINELNTEASNYLEQAKKRLFFKASAEVKASANALITACGEKSIKDVFTVINKLIALDSSTLKPAILKVCAKYVTFTTDSLVEGAYQYLTKTGDLRNNQETLDFYTLRDRTEDKPSLEKIALKYKDRACDDMVKAAIDEYLKQSKEDVELNVLPKSSGNLK